MNGYVHSVESFGTVDGPGLRFIVFVQGCGLRCAYCHNPDSWKMKEGKVTEVSEIVSELVKYKEFFDASGGGITVSGGEPLLQVKFLIELFKKLKKEGIHTCIDTSGIVAITDDIKELLKYTDLVLLDIKHIDEEKSKKLVGVSNKRELEFAQYLSDNNIKIWIRQVLVPGYTDDEEDLKKLKKFIKSLKTVEKVQVLPYHSMGRFKWEKLGAKYELEDVRDANQDDVDRAKKILEIT